MRGTGFGKRRLIMKIFRRAFFATSAQLIRVNKKRSRSQAQINAARASHPSRMFVDISIPPFSPPGATRRCYRSDSAPVGKNPNGAPLLPVPAAMRGSENHALQPPQLASSPTRSKSVKWRRPQCPDKSHALTRYQMSSGNSPSRIASCCQRHRNHRSTDLRSLTFSLQPLCGRGLRRSNKK
jgi:hypothetical protein